MGVWHHAQLSYPCLLGQGVLFLPCKATAEAGSRLRGGTASYEIWDWRIVPLGHCGGLL